MKKFVLVFVMLFLSAAYVSGQEKEYAAPHMHGNTPHYYNRDFYNGMAHYQYYLPSVYVSPFAYGYYPQRNTKMYRYGYNQWRVYTHGYVYHNGRMYVR